MQDISQFNFHDAFLKSIVYNWESKKVDIFLTAFLERESQENAMPCQLTLLETTHLVIPHQAPWGNSAFINSISKKEKYFEIEMQSGDIMKIEAASCIVIPQNG